MCNLKKQSENRLIDTENREVARSGVRRGWEGKIGEEN